MMRNGPQMMGHNMQGQHMRQQMPMQPPTI